MLTNKDRTDTSFTNYAQLLVRRRKPVLNHIIASLIVVSLALLVVLISETSQQFYFTSFLFLSLLIVGYSIYQIIMIRKYHSPLWLLNPTVLYAIMGHIILTSSFVLLLLFPEELLTQFFVHLNSEIGYAHVYYQLLNLSAAIAIWSGYWSRTASQLAVTINKLTLIRKLHRNTLKPNKKSIWIIAIISVIAHLISIKLGVFGYSSSYEQLYRASSYTQYLSMLRELGTVVLIAISLSYFSGQKKIFAIFIIIFLIKLFFGILSGYKTGIVLPVIIVGLSYFAQKQKFPAWLIPAFLFSILIAYAIIEPFRKERYDNIYFDGSNIYSIIGAFENSQAVNNTFSQNLTAPIGPLTQFLSRHDGISTAVPGIQYIIEGNALPDNSPHFLSDIFLSPVYAVIPRVIFDSKPINDLGLWYNNEIMGNSSISATAMFPVTYLYFSGGFIAVIIGFYVVGIIQSCLFRGFMSLGGAMSFVVLCMLGFLGNVNSVYYSFYITLIRNLPIILFFQWLLFYSAKKQPTFIFKTPEKIAQKIPLPFNE